METWVWILIGFLLVDAVFTVWVLRRVVGRRREREPTDPEDVGRSMGLGPDA